MSRRTFSEKAANQFLHKAFRAPPGDETVELLAKDWRAAVDANFTVTPDQRKVLDALPSDASELIQSTLATALGNRGRARAAGLEVRFAEAPPTQTRPVEILVERTTAERGAADPTLGDAERDPGWEIYLVQALILGAIICITELNT